MPAPGPVVIDGKLDDPCWKAAATTGPLKVAQGAPGNSTTEAFVLRDADRLYVGLRCAGKPAEKGDGTAGRPAAGSEFAELSINSNGDRNSYYRIRNLGVTGTRKARRTASVRRPGCASDSSPPANSNPRETGRTTS